MIHVGDARTVLTTLPEASVQTCVTSPPYWGLRDYGTEGQLGLEETPEAYVAAMVEVFREVRRVLKDDGTLWLNLGDSYAANWSSRRPEGGGGFKEDKGRDRVKNPSPGLKSKDLVGIPWMVAFALRADGWYLRSDIIWAKPNPMPESVLDRPTKSHEYLFLLTKSARYFYDAEASAEPAKYAGTTRKASDPITTKNGQKGKYGATAFGFTQHDKVIKETRNRRSVWTVTTSPYKGAHFATFPPKLIEPCILSGSKRGDTVLDPFAGAGTTWLVSHRLGREFVGIELNPEYAEMARRRIHSDAPLFAPPPHQI